MCSETAGVARQSCWIAPQSSSFSNTSRGSPGPGKRAKRVPPVPTPQDGIATREALQPVGQLASMSSRARASCLAEVLVVRLEVGPARTVVLGQDLRTRCGRGRLIQRVKAARLPASTLRMLPVDLAERSLAKKADRLGDVLGIDAALQQAALAVVLLERFLVDAVGRRALLAPLARPDARAAQHRVGVDDVAADAERRALEREAAREVQLGRLGGVVGRRPASRRPARSCCRRRRSSRRCPGAS